VVIGATRGIVPYVEEGMPAEARPDDYQRELEPHRRAITLHCYRMLGSLADAEEVVQETFLKAGQRMPELRSSSSARAWLYKIATNTCLDFLRSRGRRTLPHLIHSPEGTLQASSGRWIEPAPDSVLDLEPAEPEARVSMRESIGLALIAALQTLSPKQRAALLLIDVLGWAPPEAAKLLETTVTSVNSLLQRARRGVEDRAPRAGGGTTPNDEELLRRYIATWESGDVDAFANLLAEDAILSMPPELRWLEGRDGIMAFLRTVAPQWAGQYRMFPLRANGGAAAAVYRQQTVGGPHQAAAISLLSMRDGEIAGIVRFGFPWLFPRFGLAPQL
jgi:RNA polymerase sigma-70 factor, ECF subfamily